MKIRNTGTNPVIFNGGIALCNRTIEVDEKVGHALLSYPFIKEVEEVKIEEVRTLGEVDNSKKNDELEQLKAEAKELNIKGYALMKADTLKVKIEEVKKGQ